MRLTLATAAEHIGRKVIYTPPGGVYLPPRPDRDVGVITSVTEHYVFVRYGADTGSKATRPEDLELETA